MASGRGSFDMVHPQRPQLPRDARGSLEVFQPPSQPQTPRSKSDNSVPGPSKQDTAERSRPTLLKRDGLRDQVFPSRPVEGSEIPKFDSSSFSNNEAQVRKNTKENPLTEASAAAERAAGWGLVVKADVGSGAIKGVGVRNAEDKSLRNSGTSSCRKTSEESDRGIESFARIPRVSEDLKEVLSSFQQTFVVCDAKPDFPILYASAGFFNMTGYSAKEVIGRNCRFLQGADTDPADVSKIRQSVQQGKNYCGRLLNYKKDGTPFWNLLTISPIKDEDNHILKFIGMLVEVSKVTEGYKDKALRPNGLPESLIKYDARQKDNVAVAVSELVDALKTPNPDQQNERDVAEEATLSPVNEKARKKRKSSGLVSLLRKSSSVEAPLDPFKYGNEIPEAIDDLQRRKELRKGFDLATTLERIEKNFVITDPRLPDNPIIFASDSFLELTDYSREEILGKNCRFLQGPDTNPETVKKIRDAIHEHRSVTVQLLNYTKTGKPFWNLFHLQPMRDNKGELQYFIGVQLDGSQQFDSTRKKLPEKAERDGVQLITSTASNVDNAVRELPDANQTLDDLWSRYSDRVLPKPHKIQSASWAAINEVLEQEGALGFKHFKPVKSLGNGDTGGVHLVELRGTGHFFAMKAMDKTLMLTRNKVHRTLMERDILDLMDHPFLPTLYTSFQTDAHVCLITDFCPGGELFLLLDRQPTKTFPEHTTRFYAAQVIVALEYLHCKGVVYRDLKPENILVQANGHILLADFDLSFMSGSNPKLVPPRSDENEMKLGHCLQITKEPDILPTFVAEPLERSNSFVGTEEYIAPEVIRGHGHSSAVDWWALGILLFEMLYGWTPFRGKNRQKTFHNVVHSELIFPRSIETSLPARQLIHSLLQKDPAARLGSSCGASEIKRHAFFHGVRWPLIRCQAVPKLDSPIALINELNHKEEYCDVF
uniref:non-specific serine/threonine protein kinase n=1 Tax=Selaginella kraussiana TaxID=81964 RepID=A0A059UF56_9TRAC|nr:phototropin [Selaginella kraussiana]